MGVVRVRDGQVVDTRYSLIRPPLGHDGFEPGNVRIHGIRPADVAHAPTFDLLWDWMCENISPEDPDSVLVAHNAVFDTGVIKAANRACGGTARNWDYACTLRLARAAYTLRSYALPSASRAAGRRSWSTTMRSVTPSRAPGSCSISRAAVGRAAWPNSRRTTGSGCSARPCDATRLRSG
nr:exonuclease domain-containing protein [Kocuria indica]